MNLKAMERKMLSELTKNSRRSDRELAKAIGASQPTATRIRTKLEKEGYVKEYTTIPNMKKLGYSIMAFTFFKFDPKLDMPAKDYAEFRSMHYEALEKNSNATLLVKRGMGLGFDAVIISLHTDYDSCDKFRDFARHTMGERITDMGTFLVNLEEEKNSLPLSFAMFASQLLSFTEKVVGEEV
jgi:DNA-binding Lrp family transcriptional regulator